MASSAPETATETKAYESHKEIAGSREAFAVSSCSFPAAVVMMTIDACTMDSARHLVSRAVSVVYNLLTLDGKARSRRRSCEHLVASGSEIATHPVAKYCGSGMTDRMISTCGAGVTHWNSFRKKAGQTRTSEHEPETMRRRRMQRLYKHGINFELLE